MFGSYVLASLFSGVVGLTFAMGYGCVFQIGGFLFLIFFPTVVVCWLLVVIGGAIQRWVWRRIARPANTEVNFRVTDLLTYSFLATAAMLLTSIWMGAEFREFKARTMCQKAEPLLAILREEKTRTGSYPLNLRAYGKTHVSWPRNVRFYYGETNGQTTGLDWLPHRVAGSDITLLAFSNRLECIVPIERMSPISFSSFQVFTSTPEHPRWFKSKLHWSLAGAHIDPSKN